MDDDNVSEPPYEVGRGKPPKSTQFAPGKSGNPKGRRKGSRNFATTIQAELKRPVTVTEDGRRKKISKREAVAKQLVNKAAAGDHRAIPVLLNETRPYETDSDGATRESFALDNEDQLVLENIVKRIREGVSSTQSGSGSDAPDSPDLSSEPAKAGSMAANQENE
jgi:hypothetical protein